MAPHSSTLAWKIPWTEEPGRLQFMGSLESDMTERLHVHFSLSCTGEGNGNPLQCSCLENPRDGKPGGLLSLGSHRVRHDWSDLAAAAAVFSMVMIVSFFLPFLCIYSQVILPHSVAESRNLNSLRTIQYFHLWIVASLLIVVRNGDWGLLFCYIGDIR